MRKLVITQNITLDGSIEMLGEWFDPQGQGGDTSDVVEALQEHQGRADAMLNGRQTFEDMRGYWPQQTDDTTGVTEYLNNVDKYVVSSTMTDPGWQNSTVLSGDPVEQVRGLKERAGKDTVLTGSISLGHAPDRRRTGRRVPPVRLPRRAGARSAAVPGRLRDPTAQGAGHEVIRVRHHPARLRPAGLSSPTPGSGARIR